MTIEELFNTITATDVQKMVDEKREENLFLEFKTVKYADLRDKDDRKNLAKALSGFANSSGGIVIWGVIADKRDAQGPDCACDVKEISPVSAFVSRLNEFTGMFVRPSVDGVQHRKILTSGDSGFAISIVPESEAGPHMALAGEQRYYKRSGSSFYRMEHFDIEDMFGRRKKPRLQVCRSIRAGGSITGAGPVRYPGTILLGLENQGRGSATNLFFGLREPQGFPISRYGIDGNGTEGLPRLVGGSKGYQKYGGGPGVVLHPGMPLEIASLRFQLTEGQIKMPDCLIAADVAADGVALHRLTTTIPGSEILSAVMPSK